MTMNANHVVTTHVALKDLYKRAMMDMQRSLRTHGYTEQPRPKTDAEYEQEAAAELDEFLKR